MESDESGWNSGLEKIKINNHIGFYIGIHEYINQECSENEMLSESYQRKEIA